MEISQLFQSSVLLILAHLLQGAVTQQCRSETSILGWMLQGHIYKTMQAYRPHACVFACYKDDRCQSLNWVISLLTCEFSNRTKEARPEDFIPNADRSYFKRESDRGKYNDEGFDICYQLFPAANYQESPQPVVIHYYTHFHLTKTTLEGGSNGMKTGPMQLWLTFLNNNNPT